MTADALQSQLSAAEEEALTAVKLGMLAMAELVELGDLWCDGESLHELLGPRIPGPGVRGIGCVNASNLASLPGQGSGLKPAVSETADRLRECIASIGLVQISYLLPGHR